MTSEERIAGYLGLAARGRRVESGGFSVEKAVKSGKACLTVIAGDASDNTKKKFQNMCEYYRVPCILYADREALGAAVGKPFRATAAVTDRGLADAVLRVLQQKV